MSCLKFIDEFSSISKEQAEGENPIKDQILDEAVKCFDLEEDKRNRELLNFIQDFVVSPEYADYIQEKRNIIKRSVGTQCALNEIIVECKNREESMKYPLTLERRKLYEFKKKFEEYAERQEIERTIKNQERGIKLIRAKIQEAKRFFDCTYESRQKERENYDCFIMQKYSTKFGIDLNSLSATAQSKLLEKFKRCHNAHKIAKKRRQENTFEILRKLIKEFKWKKEAKKEPREFKIKRSERIIDDMEVVGTKIELIDRNKIEEIEPEIAMEDVSTKTPNIEEPKTKKKAKKDKGKKEKSVDKAKKPKTEKKEKGKKKKKEKGQKEKPKFLLPDIPIVNPREKLLPENILNLVDLVEDFWKFEGAMENCHMQREQSDYKTGDKGLKFLPKDIAFVNFQEKKIYTKTIRITNVSAQIRKVRFLKFDLSDDFDPLAFDIEPFGIQKLFIGCSFKFRLVFEPFDPTKRYEGKLLFLSYDVRNCQYYRSEVDVRCSPKYADLKIYPETVRFGSIPVWEADPGCRIIKFKNRGAKPCIVDIKKIFDPLDLDSTLEEDDKENENPIDFSSSDHEMVSDILDECLRNVDNNFQLAETHFRLDESEEKRVQVYFKNFNYIGDYFEKYVANVYENADNEATGCQIMSFYAETIGHFLTTEPELLDFGTCIINSCYQLSFDIVNGSSKSQAISIRIPSNLVNMVQTDVSMVYMQARTRRTVYVKIYPSQQLMEKSYVQYDKSSSILEFNVQLYVVTKQVHNNYPPVKVPIYALIGDIDDLSISCHATRNLSNFLNTILIDMGDCSIYETVWTEINVTNNTANTRFCGFVDLPEAVVLEPNCGFCKLYPAQRKKFKLYVSPEIKDFPSYSAGTLRNSNYFFKLKIESLVNVGQLFKDSQEKKSKSFIETEMSIEKKLTLNDTELFQSMNIDSTMNPQFGATTESMINKENPMISRIGSFQQSDSRQISNMSQMSQKEEEKDCEVDTVLNYQNFLIVETSNRREIWCKVNIKRPLLEFSHQFVVFPDTPVGSYSMMRVNLIALDREMERMCTNKRSHLEFRAYFQIVGESDEISVQPSCGTLEAGKSMEIYLIAKPNVPDAIIEQTVLKMKRAELYEKKLREFLARAKKHGSDKKTIGKTKKEKKDTKSDKKKKKDKEAKSETAKSKEQEPNIIVSDGELSIEETDLYPAEMVYWRSLEPYYIKMKFTCIITYEAPKVHKKQDKLYLEAECKAIRPDFSLNVVNRKIDFGNCLIGTKIRKTIVLQNITYHDIRPKTSLLNPIGSFSIPFLPNLKLPSEHYLKIPIQFEPTISEQVIEYVEIKSGTTTVPLILTGTGILPVINIQPRFRVFRLEAKQQKLAELQLKIENSSEVEASIVFHKLFEIEARVGDLVMAKETAIDAVSEKEDQKKKGKSKEKKSKRSKSPKKDAHSDALSESELQLINAHFGKVEGDSHFDLKSPTNYVEIAPHKTHPVVILCGEPELIKQKKLEGPKRGKKEKTKEKTSKKSDTLTNKQEDNKTNLEDKQYITQYNLQLGKSHLKSIIIVCTVKNS